MSPSFSQQVRVWCYCSYYYTASDSSDHDIISNHTLQWQQTGSRYCVLGITHWRNVKMIKHIGAGVGRTGPSLPADPEHGRYSLNPPKREGSEFIALHACCHPDRASSCSRPFNLLPSLMVGREFRPKVISDVEYCGHGDRNRSTSWFT